MTLLKIKLGKQTSTSTVNETPRETITLCSGKKTLIQTEEKPEHEMVNLISPFPSRTQQSGTRGTFVDATHA